MSADDAAPVQLLFSGDAMLGRGVNRVIQREDPTYPLDPITAITRDADLFFTNLECAISPREQTFSGAEKTFYFRADPPAAETLMHAGVDAVSLANNHALDADVDGLRDTLAILDDHGIAHAGAGEDRSAACQPAIVEANGQTLGLLAFCDHQANFAATENRPGIWHADLSNAEAKATLRQRVEAASQEIDLLIVAAHWQPNWVPRIAGRIRQLAETLVEAGATMIWGYSPHHVQGVEWIADSAVLYSTGGLVDDYAVDDHYRNDRQLLFEVGVSGAGVERVRAFPIELDYARTHPATGEARDWIIRRFTERCREVGSQVEAANNWLHVHPA